MLKSRDKTYYWNLLTLTVSIDDVHKVGVRSAGEDLASERVAYDVIITKDDGQFGTEGDAEYGTVFLDQLLEIQVHGIFDEE